MELNQEKISELHQLTESVEAEHTEAVQTQIETKKAEARLLQTIIDIVKPAIRALGIRPVIKRSVVGYEDFNTVRHVPDVFYPHRCLLLSGYSWGPEEDNPRDNSGIWEGCDLALREDGVLIMVTYEGTWSKWQGSNWGWKAEVVEYDDAADAINSGKWVDVEYYIERIFDGLQKAQGTREKTTKTNLIRVKKLHALCDLLE